MNPLTDILPPHLRRYVYAAAFLAAIVWGAWVAAGGDWGTFVAALVGTLVSGLAASNTPKHTSRTVTVQTDAAALEQATRHIAASTRAVQQLRQRIDELDRKV